MLRRSFGEGACARVCVSPCLSVAGFVRTGRRCLGKEGFGERKKQEPQPRSGWTVRGRLADESERLIRFMTSSRASDVPGPSVRLPTGLREVGRSLRGEEKG